MRDLQASLRDHPMAMLRAIAELNDVELTTNAREDASAQLASALRVPELVHTALQRCSNEAQAAWQALAAAGGQMKVPVFARRFGTLRPVGPGKLERDMIWRAPASPAEELWYHGLIYRAFADLGGGPSDLFYIPDDLAAAAPQAHNGNGGPAGRTPAQAALAVGQPPVQVQRSFNSLAIDACTLMSALSELPLRVDAGGGWRATDEVRLRETLLLPDPVRFSLLMALGQDAGWLATEAGRLQVRNEKFGDWLRDNVWAQRSALFTTWRDSTVWNDLRRMPSLRAEGEWRNDPAGARRAVLAALAGLQPGAWHAIADIVAWIKDHDPDFQRPDGNYSGWYLRDTATGRYLSGFESWDEVEGRLIYFMISEPLFWLAAVELGVSAEGQREVFRLSPAGAAWIAGGPVPEFPEIARLQIEEDFHITAPPFVPLADRFRLLRFSEPAVGPIQPGEPTRHRITRRSLARARANGLHADKILQFLRHAAGGRVPARIEAGLQRWEQHGGAVHVTKGAVLQVQDASVLAKLRADPIVGPLLGELISAQAVVVSSAALPRVLAALAELGYNTRVDG